MTVMRALAVLSAAAAVGAVSLCVSHAVAGSGQLDYYVASTGTDSPGNGTSLSHPWATIQYAADHVSLGAGGTVVHVAAGTYTTTIENDTSGKPGAYLTFVSDTTWAAKIVTDSGDANDYPFRNNGSYVRIIGFDVSEQRTGKSPEGILSYGSHNTVQGNNVHDIDPPCTDRGGDGIGTDQTASDTLITGNWVHDIGSGPACEKIHGIYPSGAGDVVVNNIAYHNLGSGILFNHSTGGATIANNLSFANANHGISIDAGDGTGDNFVITNNIVLNNAMFGINVHSSANGAHNQYRNNLLRDNEKGGYGLDNDPPPGNWPPNTSGTITADPGLADYLPDGTGDYHLTAHSPGVDAGTPLGAPDIDYDGLPRPQGAGYDIGPYEFPSGTTTTTTTTTITFTTTPPGTVAAGSRTAPQRAGRTCTATPSPGS